MMDDNSLTDADSENNQASEEVVRNLTYWLAMEDIYTSPYVREWLARTPERDAADVLAKIALHARPEPRSLVRMMVNTYMMVFSTSEVVRVNSPAGRKAGKRAAILLVNLGDPRCLAPLVGVFELHWFWKSGYQDRIETALLRFLTGPAADIELNLYSEELRVLAEKLWRSGGRNDLSDRQAQLLIADLTCLSRVATDEALATLQIISSGYANTTNRLHVQEAVIGMLRAATTHEKTMDASAS